VVTVHGNALFRRSVAMKTNDDRVRPNVTVFDSRHLANRYHADGRRPFRLGFCLRLALCSSVLFRLCGRVTH
jgi:hypothetical protein